MMFNAADDHRPEREGELRVLTKKRLAEFWEDPRHPHSEEPLSAWYQVVSRVRWDSFADVKATYNSADLVGNKTVFNVGGNRIRVVTVINYETRQVFIRAVLDHKEYDKGHWKKDLFGRDWKPLGPKKRGPREKKQRKRKR